MAKKIELENQDKKPEFNSDLSIKLFKKLDDRFPGAIKAVIVALTLIDDKERNKNETFRT